MFHAIFAKLPVTLPNRWVVSIRFRLVDVFVCLHQHALSDFFFSINWRRNSPKACYKWLMIERKKEVYEWRRYYTYEYCVRLSAGCCCLKFHACHTIEFAFRIKVGVNDTKKTLTETQTDETRQAQQK